MKFFGLGIEAGSNIDQEKTIGARFTAERGKDLLGIRGTALVLTSDFEEYGFVVRPEIVLYPLKKQLFSIGVGFNFGRNFNRNKLHFGILALNAAYNFALKK